MSDVFLPIAGLWRPKNQQSKVAAHGNLSVEALKYAYTNCTDERFAEALRAFAEAVRATGCVDKKGEPALRLVLLWNDKQGNERRPDMRLMLTEDEPQAQSHTPAEGWGS